MSNLCFLLFYYQDASILQMTSRVSWLSDSQTVTWKKLVCERTPAIPHRTSKTACDNSKTMSSHSMRIPSSSHTLKTCVSFYRVRCGTSRLRVLYPDWLWVPKKWLSKWRQQVRTVKPFKKLHLLPHGIHPWRGQLVFLWYGWHYINALFGLSVYRQIYPNLVVSKWVCPSNLKMACVVFVIIRWPQSSFTL